MTADTNLGKMREFVASFPDFDILGEFRIDYTDQVPDNGGLFPTGLVEVARRTDITGFTYEVENQLNFALYTVLAKPPGDDAGATFNAEWQMGFQEWVQEQSVRGLAPAFGDKPLRERIAAQNGQLYSADAEGTALYMIQISVNYIKEF